MVLRTRLIWSVALNLFEHVVINLPARRAERQDTRDLSSPEAVIEELAKVAR